ncbi:MAG: hypothetical protein BGN86_08170 [Caulobacterales bacterium 68-7]|nr:MAG: hypothetical protein BGN86_08170 [Caulobacterales bacterium 68-7]
MTRSGRRRWAGLAGVAALLLGLLFAQGALADPCEAIPEDGRLPGYLTLGATFTGQVVEVIDGDSLCVAVGPTPREWVEVRLGDFYAPEVATPEGLAARAALEGLAKGHTAQCVAGFATYDRIAAVCRIDGASIGDQMRAAGIKESGKGLAAREPPRAIILPPTPIAPTPVATPLSAPAGSGPCEAFRARGGVRVGEPGYRLEWDSDRDGIACEPLGRRRR